MHFKATAIPACHAETCRSVANNELKKLLLAMKLTAIILLTACLTTSAAGHTQGISFSGTNTELKTVLKDIERQSGYQVFFNERLLKDAKRVTVNFKNASLEEALDACFKDQPLNYAIINRTIVVKRKAADPNVSGDNESINNLPPPIDVHGRIVNEKGEPVIASIQVKGTNKGVTTDDNGEFELKRVDDFATLVISGVSIETFEVKLNGRTELAMNAKMKTVVGENVTVSFNTGYEKIPKERSTGSFETFDKEALSRKSSIDILSRLEGVAVSVLFDKRQMSPNAIGIDPSNTLIRGLSTLTEGSMKSPLIVVNNFPYEGNINCKRR